MRTARILAPTDMQRPVGPAAGWTVGMAEPVPTAAAAGSRSPGCAWIRNGIQVIFSRETVSRSGERSIISTTDLAFQRCISPACGATYAIDEVRVACGRCGNLLDVAYDWPRLAVPRSLAGFEEKWARRSDPHCFSGVWRFHELLPFAPVEQCVTVGEGQTLLHALGGRGPVRRACSPAGCSCSTRG